MRYAIMNLSEVEDSAAKFGYGDLQESRFPREALGMAQTGMAYHVLKPGKRQPFGHRHHAAEEVHVVLWGAGRVNVDGEVVELQPLDVLRLAPDVTRVFEAGPDGMAFLVFGPRHEKDAEVVKDAWG